MIRIIDNKLSEKIFFDKKARKENIGKFLVLQPCGTWVAIDNTTGDAWCEEFIFLSVAISWLNGEFDRDDMLDYAFDGNVREPKEMEVHWDPYMWDKWWYVKFISKTVKQVKPEQSIFGNYEYLFPIVEEQK